MWAGAITSGPFAETAELYHSLGWPVLPVGNRPGEKSPPLAGRTGWDGADADLHEIRAWSTSACGELNVALRMPPGVVGLDVDHGYLDPHGQPKRGQDTLREHEQLWGLLPSSAISTSREAGGIRFFRVPVGTLLAGGLGPWIETIQRHHRFAVVWPSTKDGRLYRWSTGRPPSVADLPELPGIWVEKLTKLARARRATRKAHALIELGPVRDACTTMLVEVERWVELLADPRVGRHDTARNGQYRLCQLGVEGHAGLTRAVEQLRLAYLNAAGGSREDEFDRALDGALIVFDPPDVEQCQSCAVPVDIVALSAFQAVPAVSRTFRSIVARGDVARSVAYAVDKARCHLLPLRWALAVIEAEAGRPVTRELLWAVNR